MKLSTTKSKSLVSGVLIAASFAFAASTAMAAAPHKATVTHYVGHTRHVASIKHGPVAWQQPFVPFFAGLFGLPFPVATYAAPNVTTHVGRGAVASRSGSSDDYSLQQTLEANHQAEQQLEQQNTWAQQQSTFQEEQDSADELNQEASEMTASQAAADAQNALANDMANQYMMNQVNSQ